MQTFDRNIVEAAVNNTSSYVGFGKYEFDPIFFMQQLCKRSDSPNNRWLKSEIREDIIVETAYEFLTKEAESTLFKHLGLERKYKNGLDVNIDREYYDKLIEGNANNDRVVITHLIEDAIDYFYKCVIENSKDESDKLSLMKAIITNLEYNRNLDDCSTYFCYVEIDDEHFHRFSELCKYYNLAYTPKFLLIDEEWEHDIVIDLIISFYEQKS